MTEERNTLGSIPNHSAKQIEGHVIVCGLKGVGLRTVEQCHLPALRDQPVASNMGPARVHYSG